MLAFFFFFFFLRVGEYKAKPSLHQHLHARIHFLFMRYATHPHLSFPTLIGRPKASASWMPRFFVMLWGRPKHFHNLLCYAFQRIHTLTIIFCGVESAYAEYGDCCEDRRCHKRSFTNNQYLKVLNHEDSTVSIRGGCHVCKNWWKLSRWMYRVGYPGLKQIPGLGTT